MLEKAARHEEATRRGVTVPPELISEAGIATARAAHKVWRERNYEAIVLCGGARSTRHWTELAGEGIAITLSGALAGALIDEHPPVIARTDAAAPEAVINQLRQTFPDFVRACDEGAIAPEDFRPYGPVQRFQNSLLDGLATIIGEIQSRQVIR